MTTKTEVTTAQRLAILKHLAGGKDLDTTAAIMRGISRDTIGEIARHHGYPDPDKLSWAVDILSKKADEEAAASIPTTAHVPQPMTRPAARPASTSPSSVTSPEGTIRQGPDEIRVLLNAAKSHPAKRIQTAADRVFDALGRLRTMMREDEEKHAAKRKADAEKAAARAEVERLERQLAAAKAKLRGKSTAQHPGGRAAAESGQLAQARAAGQSALTSNADLEPLGLTSKSLRAWAAENDIDCPDAGRVPRRVLEAWQAAQQDGAA